MTTQNDELALHLAREELDELRARVDCRAVLEADWSGRDRARTPPAARPSSG